MESDSPQPPRDTTPDQDPPRQGSEKWVRRFRSMEMNHDIGENSSSILLEEYVKEMELKELSLRNQFLELSKKEERLKLVEVREKKMRLLEEVMFERLVSLHEKENEFDLKQFLEADVIRLVSELQILDSMGKKQEEADLIAKSIDEKSRELEMKRKEFDLKLTEDKERKSKEAVAMGNFVMNLEMRENCLKVLDENFKEKFAQLEKIEQNQKADAGEIEARRIFLEGKEKKLGEMEKELELKLRGCGESSRQAETRKRTSFEFRSSFSGENGSDTDSPLVRPEKMRKISRGHNHNKEADLARVLHGKTGSDFASTSKHTSKAKRREEEEVDEIIFIDDDETDLEPQPYNCPDPDFNNFNKTMSSFAEGQVWALYDPTDDMPRYYAQIGRVFKYQPSLRVRWLEPVLNTENEKSIPIACGRFKYGESEAQGRLMFSHVMDHVIGSKSVTINPRKGETWALFRDWTDAWISHREQHKPPYRYDFVEVVSEFDSVQGIEVAYLGRVEEFTSVYKHADQHGLVKTMVSSDEMLRFSHRVPSFKMTGNEKEGVPVGSFELDPAAIRRGCLQAAKVKEEKN